MANEDEKAAEEAKQAAAEAKKAEEQRIADLVNKAAADHAKRTQAKFDKALEDRDAKILALSAELEASKKAREDGDGGKKKVAEDETSKKLREMEARLIERDKKLEEERQARETEKKARLADEEKSETMAALTAADITDVTLQEGAYAVVRKAIRRDEDGKIWYFVQKDGYEDKIPVRDGVKAWAMEGAGKSFVAPKGVAGSGTRPGKSGPAPKGNDRGSRVAEARKTLAAAFGVKE